MSILIIYVLQIIVNTIIEGFCKHLIQAGLQSLLKKTKK